MVEVIADFTDVESGGDYLPEGQYQAEVESVELKEGTRAEYLLWVFSSIELETKGMISTIMTSLSEKALWKLKEVIEALGGEAEGPTEIDTDTYLGRVATITVAKETYTGEDGQEKTSHKIVKLFPPVEDAAPVAEADDTDDIPF